MQAATKTTILVIEDEPDIQELLEYNLQREGYDVILASDGQYGLDKAKEYIPELILLDLMLPKMDGFAICKHLRETAKTQHIPIIIITAKSEETDTIHGLDLGADDYIIKPFKTQELLARIKVHLRRYNLYKHASKSHSSHQETYRLGPLVLDRKRHIIFLHETPLILTLSEFKLLAALISAPGQVFTRSELLGYIAEKNVHLVERNIDVHILSIRKKLGEYAQIIETIRGVGYKCKYSTS